MAYGEIGQWIWGQWIRRRASGLGGKDDQVAADLLADLLTGQGWVTGRGQHNPQRQAVDQLANRHDRALIFRIQRKIGLFTPCPLHKERDTFIAQQVSFVAVRRDAQPLHWQQPFIRLPQRLARGYDDFEARGRRQQLADQIGTVQQMFIVVEDQQTGFVAQVGTELGHQRQIGLQIEAQAIDDGRANLRLKRIVVRTRLGGWGGEIGQRDKVEAIPKVRSLGHGVVTCFCQSVGCGQGQLGFTHPT